MFYELYNAILEILFINMVENLFLTTFVFIMLGIKSFDIKHILTVLIISFSGKYILFDNNVLLFMFITVVVYLFYRDYNINYAKVFKNMIYAIITMFIIQTAIYFPLVVFFKIDIVAISKDTIHLIILSIPARLFEWSYIYILNKNRRVIGMKKFIKKTLVTIKKVLTRITKIGVVSWLWIGDIGSDYYEK